MAIFKPKIPFATIAISFTDTHGTIVSYQPSLATTGTYGHTTGASTKPISKTIDNMTDTNDPPNYNTHDVDYFPWQDRQPVIPQDISTDTLPSLIDESPIHQQTHWYQ